MNNADMLELTDLDTTLEIFTLRENYWREPEKLKAELAKRSDRTKQFAPGMLPSKPILGMTMFSQCGYPPADPHQPETDLSARIL